MIDKTKRASYLIKLIELEKKIFDLNNKMEENFIGFSLYFELGIPVDKKMLAESDRVGAELNKAITDFRYYNMLLNESEDFSYLMN